VGTAVTNRNAVCDDVKAVFVLLSTETFSKTLYIYIYFFFLWSY
jgi:hypothetical protein